MGSGASSPSCKLTPEEQEQKKKASQRNNAISQQLEKDKIDSLKVIKLLLLGAAESGKSTFAKQMKILHEDGFTVSERLSYKQLVFSNTLHSMRDIINPMGELDIQFQDQAREADVKLLDIYCDQVDRYRTPFDVDICQAIRRLWKDPGVQQSFVRSREYQLNDSAEYFISSIERFSNEDYVPTDQDILRTRLKTSGIVQTTFLFRDFTFRMYDVGGQRSERRKWIHCFDNVTAIIFIAAISEFDQVLREDNRMNRLIESLNLFKSVYNCPYFGNTCFILFLNKRDILQKKLKVSSVKCCFPNYTGTNEFVEVSQYIRAQFESVRGRRGKDIYTHLTVATDTSNIRFVFDTSMAVVLKKNLEEAGMF